MRRILMAAPWLALVLAGCAAQPASEQIARPETVRICQGNTCSDQHRSTATFQADRGDPEAERRMSALAHLAESDPKAAYDLGMRLLRGDGVERNAYQAIEWLRKAGDRGHLAAQIALGRIYLTGVGEMGADPAEAETWLSMAAARGDKDSQRLLGEAQAAKQDEQRAYQVRDAYRKSWGRWYYSVPYYWVWGPAGWYLH